MRARHVRTILAATLVGAVALVATPAHAGGPTSAILSVPGAGQTASLYYTDPEYDELSELLGMSMPGETAAGEESGTGHANGPGITVTWLIHDVEPWRVDRIYLGGEDGPWVSTQSSMDGSIWEAPEVWHQPADGKRLAALLSALGMVGDRGEDTGNDAGRDGGSADPAADDAAGAGQAATATESSTAPATTSEESAPADQTWTTSAGWAAGGLATGVVLALAWSRSRRRPGADRPADLASSGSWEIPDGHVEHLTSR